MRTAQLPPAGPAPNWAARAALALAIALAVLLLVYVILPAVWRQL